MLPASATVTQSGGSWVPGSAGQRPYSSPSPGPVLAVGAAWLLQWHTPSCQPAGGLWLPQPGPQYCCLWRRRDALGLGREKGMFGYKRDQFEWKLIQFVPGSLNSSHSIPWLRPPFSSHLTYVSSHLVMSFPLPSFPPYLYRLFDPLLERENRYIWC